MERSLIGILRYNTRLLKQKVGDLEEHKINITNQTKKTLDLKMDSFEAINEYSNEQFVKWTDPFSFPSKSIHPEGNSSKTERNWSVGSMLCIP